jgi:hypothetical protein
LAGQPRYHPQIEIDISQATNLIRPPAPTFASNVWLGMIGATNITFASLSTFQAKEADALDFQN